MSRLRLPLLFLLLCLVYCLLRVNFRTNHPARTHTVMFSIQIGAYPIPFWVITNVPHIVSLRLGICRDVPSNILHAINKFSTTRFCLGKGKPNGKSCSKYLSGKYGAYHFHYGLRLSTATVQIVRDELHVVPVVSQEILCSAEQTVLCGKVKRTRSKG